MKKILIYKDKGADDFGLASLISALKYEKIDQKYCLAFGNKDLFLSGGWQKDTHLVIFPGGRDIPYHHALKGEGNAHIRDFVEKGGNFLGICAGGYYGSAEIEFEKNGPLEVLGKRELKFFPGIARGPALGLGKFDYRSDRGAQIAKLRLATSHPAAAYYNGGCAFVHAEKYQTISVLVRYADIEEEPAAIVKCQVGKGVAILSGVHPEYSVLHECTSKHIQGSLFSALQEIEKERQEVFSRIMDELVG